MGDILKAKGQKAKGKYYIKKIYSIEIYDIKKKAKTSRRIFA